MGAITEAEFNKPIEATDNNGYKSEFQSNAYYHDEPILKEGGDLLGRKEFAKRLAKYIDDLPARSSVTIGVYGSWGCGKTSLLNMALDNLPKNSVVVVRFNPWDVIGGQELVVTLFGEIQKELKTYLSGETLDAFGKILEDYASVIGAGISMGATLLTGTVIPSEASTFVIKRVAKHSKKAADQKIKSVSGLKEEVAKYLSSIDKNILVVIDDIDRLSNDRIALIFQLVASVASFPGVNYLVAFDKKVVTRALKPIHGDDGDSYLEKVIQVPITIPDVSKAALASYVEEKVGKIVSLHDSGSYADDSDLQLARVIHGCVMPFVQTLRDAKRFLNVLGFELSYVDGKIRSEDVVGITALKVFCPQVFEWAIRRRRNPLEEFSGIGASRLHHAVADSLKRVLEVDDATAQKAAYSLAVLFRSSEQSVAESGVSIEQQVLRVKRSIAHPDLWALYFEGQLYQDSFPTKQVEMSINTLPEEDLAKAFSDELQNWQSSDFLYGVIGKTPSLNSYRAYVVARSMLSAIAQVGDSDLGLHLSSWPLLILYDCMRLMESGCAAKLLLEFVPQMGKTGLLAIGHVLYDMQLRREHSRNTLTWGGSEESIISESEMRSIEEAYSQAMSSRMEEFNPFLYEYSRSPMIAWVKADESAHKYLDRLFEDPMFVIDCALTYLCESTAGSKHGGWEYDASTFQFVETQQVQRAIDEVVKSGTFVNFSEEKKINLAALNVAMSRRAEGALLNVSVSYDQAMMQLEDWAAMRSDDYPDE